MLVPIAAARSNEKNECLCVCACGRACGRAGVCVCVYIYMYVYIHIQNTYIRECRSGLAQPYPQQVKETYYTG